MDLPNQGWLGGSQSNLKPVVASEVLGKVSKPTGHTQKCYVRYQEHQNRTTGSRISPYPMHSWKNG